MSSRMSEAGYKIDSLLTKYQTIDFSKKANYQCSVYGNPYADKNMNGTSLGPFEVVFVKYNDRESTTDAQERAKLYQRWIEQINVNNRTQ
ncbi:unnamed protein product [Rotaria magnacalcarata]|uniref:Uncharacterized protein n=2 Tax=Rotaria magnacalcarata TaxID=392030 RepID=A0A814MSG8_9BILA|nr:unnamed protein product [Rotaria magnacalcarata]